MTNFRARTHTEANDYMRLAVGEPCRDHPLVYQQVSIDVAVEGLSTFVTAVLCPVDDQRWEFSFVVEQSAPVDEPLRSVYGYGPEPSKLIDAGEFVWLILLYSGQAERDRGRFQDGLPDLETAINIVTWLAVTREAATEVTKFIPPGEEQVPESAIWSPLGREIQQWRGHDLNRATMDALIAQTGRAIEGYAKIYD